MKKFLACILMMFMCAVTVFSGCNLVQMNTRDYYDSVCAKVGDIEINKRELINYYSNSVQNSYSYTVDEILEELINRQLIIKEVKNNYKTYVEGIGEKLEDESSIELYAILNKYYYNSVMQQVYDYLDGKILDSENAIREARGMELAVKEEESERKTDFDVETIYEKKVTYDSVTGVWTKVNEEVQFDTIKIASYDYMHIDYGDKAIRELAYQRYIQSLIRSEQGKNLDTNPVNVLQREIDRVYDLYEESKYLEIFENNYKYNLDVDNNAVVNKYKELVLQSYSKFSLEGKSESAYNTYVKAMQSDASTVYYHPYASVENKGFIQIAHILIKFTDDQIKEYKQIVSDYETEIDNYETYQTKLDAWKGTCSGKARYTLKDQEEDATHIAGNEYGESINYMTIYNEINSALNSCSSVQEKAEKINEFIYKYGQDTGSINASKYYAVSLDNGVTESWVEGFGETAREVYSNKGAGGLSDPLYVYSKDSYAGYHIIFVVGEYENLCPITSINNLTSSYATTLYNTREMLGTTKTVYDKVYDLLTTSNYSTYREGFIKTLREGLTIKYYKYNYSDLQSSK